MAARGDTQVYRLPELGDESPHVQLRKSFIASQCLQVRNGRGTVLSHGKVRPRVAGDSVQHLISKDRVAGFQQAGRNRVVAEGPVSPPSGPQRWPWASLNCSRAWRGFLQMHQTIVVQLLQSTMRLLECPWLQQQHKGSVEVCIRTLAMVGKYASRPLGTLRLQGACPHTSCLIRWWHVTCPRWS